MMIFDKPIFFHHAKFAYNYFEKNLEKIIQKNIWKKNSKKYLEKIIRKNN